MVMHSHTDLSTKPKPVCVLGLTNKQLDKQIILGMTCEEITRIKQGAVSTPKAVDSSPSRRLDIALRNLAIGCTSATAGSKRTLVQGIVSEITKAAEGDVAAYSIGKREEIERVAASAR